MENITFNAKETMGKGVERSKVKENEVVERNKPRKKALRKVQNKWLGRLGLLSQLYHKSIYNGLNNVDIVSKEESEHRIEICGFVTGILLLIPATVLTTLLRIAVSWNPQPPMIMITPKLLDPPVHNFPEQHVALIYHDGSVYDISLNENINISQSKQLLLKLPKDKTYFGFVNERQGILNFLSSTVSRPITQFKLKHNIIPNSKPKMIDPESYHFSQGIQVGNMFWVWTEDTYHDKYHVLQTNRIPYPKTFIYYWKRNSWKEGPSFFTSEIRRPFATTSINATAAIAVFDAFIDVYNVYDSMVTYVYDFEWEKWSKYPNLKPILDEEWLSQIDFSLTTLISKTARKVYLHVSLVCFEELESNKETVWLLSYDLKDGPNGLWMVEQKGPSCVPKTPLGCIFLHSILKNNAMLTRMI